MRARTPLLLLCLNAVPALCVGQHTHQFEIGAFGSYTRYDRAFMLDKQIGGGGRLGYFFSPVVGIEVDAGYQQPTPAAGGANASLQLGSASLVLNMGNQHNLFYILGGYSRLAFGDRSGYRFTDNGVHGAIGDRVFLGERVALRIEGRAIYAPKTGFSSGNWAGHIVGSLGLAIFTGPSAFRDADLDGVADGKDACPGTPVGAVVDARGCPSDSDRDKVYDGLDACPNTVEGAEVDARGCPKDSDGDGVYDGIDKCPGTATGARVDAQGCPTDSDRDGVPDGPDQCPNTPAGATVDTTAAATSELNVGTSLRSVVTASASAAWVRHVGQFSESLHDLLRRCPFGQAKRSSLPLTGRFRLEGCAPESDAAFGRRRRR